MRAGIVGSPVAHSLSPVVHGAAYTALGLPGWRYERLECDADGLPALLAGLDEQWVGLSVTMPAKHAALAVATERSARAVAVGAANTLVAVDGGWRADCTDVDGVVGALLAAGDYRPRAGARAVLLGAGGTAAAVLAGLTELLVESVDVVVREPVRATELRATAARLGCTVRVLRISEVDLDSLAASCDVLVSTVPARAVAEHASALACAPCVLDVIYHPWPTAVGEAVTACGGRLATGLDMLLHQAFGQVEQFTGRPAPRQVMRDALLEATGGALTLSLGAV